MPNDDKTKIINTSIKDGAVRNIKTNLFTHVFSDEGALVDLYRAAGKDITTDEIEYLDLDKILQRTGRYRDTSFRTKDYRLIVFFEQQSTQSPNIPYRQLEYAVDSLRILRVFDNLNDKQNRFGSVLLQYPKIEFYVAYNGKTPLNENMDHLLVDLGDIIVKAKQVDVRFDNLPAETKANPENRLAGYAFFVKRFEELKTEGKSPHQAYDLAIAESISKGYLTDIWSREECVNVFREVYSYDDELREEAREEVIIETTIAMLKKGIKDIEVAEIIMRPIEWVRGLMVEV